MTTTTTTTMTSRPYQTTVLHAIEDGVSRQKYRQLCVLPTGAGKTYVGSQVIARYIPRQAMGMRALVLVPRIELAWQWLDAMVEEASRCYGGVAVLTGEAAHSYDATVTIATVQTLANPTTMARYLAGAPADTRYLLITDEAHHAVAPTHKAIRWRLQPALHIGLTATPQRADGYGLASLFDELSAYVPLATLIRDGYLVPVRQVQMSLGRGMTEGTRAKFQALTGREQPRAIDLLGLPSFNTVDACTKVVNAWLRHARGRPTVVFGESVDHAFKLAQAFAAVGVPAANIEGGSDKLRRRDVLRALADGRLPVVTNCQLLTEGFDQPSVACIIVARRVFATGPLQQMVGRGLRIAPNKSECVVLSVQDSLDPVGIATVDDLCGSRLPALRYWPRHTWQQLPNGVLRYSQAPLTA